VSVRVWFGSSAAMQAIHEVSCRLWDLLLLHAQQISPFIAHMTILLEF